MWWTHHDREKVTVIIVAVMGSEGGIGAREKRFRPISAVHNRQVFVVDPDLICQEFL